MAINIQIRAVTLLCSLLPIYVPKLLIYKSPFDSEEDEQMGLSFHHV